MARKRDEYWIDGYNVVHGLNLGAGRSLHERREALVGRCATLRARCWVVFDASEKPVPFRIQRPNSRLTVQFSQDGANADDTLVHGIDQARDLRIVVLVSDDRELCERFRSRGVRTLSVDRFGAKILLPPKPTRKKKAGRPDRPLSRNEVKDWMKWFGLDEPPKD